MDEIAASERFGGRVAVVTGAGGFIGAALCAALVADGADVVGAEVDEDRRDAIEATGARFAACDVRDPDRVAATVAGADLVFHTAAFIHEGDDMDAFIDLNVRGTANVLDRAAEAGVERVVHLSSFVVYGYEDPTTQDEDAPLRSYGIPYLDTKSSSDRLARLRGAVVVRCGDVIGPGSVPWTLRPLALAETGRLAIPAPGDGVMLPVHVNDLAEAVLLAALKGEPGRAYNAWNGERISFGEYFDRLVEPRGLRCRRVPPAVLRGASHLQARLPAVLRGGAPELGANALVFVDRRGSVSNERARHELGWQPRIGVERALTGLLEARPEALATAPPMANRASAGASP